MKPFLITGTQRSGTTILSFLLGNHPGIHVGQHSLAFRIIHTLHTSLQRAQTYHAPDQLDQLMETLVSQDYKNRLGDFLGEKSLTEYDSLREGIATAIADELNSSGKQCWGNKAPQVQPYLPQLLLLMPELRVVHIIRDGRAVAASAYRRGQKSLRLVAQQWVDINLQALYHQRVLGEERFLIVSYEDMLREPIPTLTTICHFLGVDFAPIMLDLSTHESTGGDTSYVSETLNPAFIDRYRAQLSNAQISAVERIAGTVLEHFSYPLVTDVKPRAIRPLSTRQRLWLTHWTNFKSIFQPVQTRMNNWQVKTARVPLRQRVGFFLRTIGRDVLSLRLYAAIFERQNRKLLP